METRTDFLKRPLEVNDFVITGTPMGQGRGLALYQIMGFTPKMVKCAPVYKNKQGYRDSPSHLYACDLCKVTGEELTWYMIST